MKSNLIAQLAGHPTGSNLLMMILVVMGLATYNQLKRETFPEFTPSRIDIRITYPGASAEEVENAVCQRVLDALDGINYVAEKSCEARENIAIGSVEWNETGEFDRLMDDVKNEIAAINTFPDDVEDAVIKEAGMTSRVVSVAVTGDMSETDLKAYAEYLKDKLLMRPEISLVTIQGFSNRQLRVEIDAFALRRYGLSLQRVMQIIASQNIKLPAGSVETTDEIVYLRFDDERQTVDELANLVIIGNPGSAVVRLGNIAAISDQFDKDEEKIIFNGKRAAFLNVDKNTSEDAIVIGTAVKEFIELEKQITSKDVVITIAGDYYSIIQERLDLLIRNGWQGILLVMVTLWLFFNIRFAFWVGMSLPVSFLGTIFFMNLIGYSINMLTMVALLIAIGLLMDDGIVIAENIATHLGRGKTALEASVMGVQEVGIGVLSSFLTTVCIFAPLAFIDGNIGKVLKVIPVVLIMTLSVSLIEAFFILPRHMGHSQSGGDSVNRFRRFFDQSIDWVRYEAFGRMVDTVINWRYLFLGFVIACFLASVSLLAGGTIKFKAFPDLEGDNIDARVLLPQGTPLVKTEALIGKIIQGLETVNEKLSPQQPGGASLVKNVKIQYGVNSDANESGSHVATISVDLLGTAQRTVTIDTFLNAWRDQVKFLPDVIAISFKEPGVGPAGLAIDIRLQGQELSSLKSASIELQNWLLTYDGVLDLYDDLRLGSREIRYKLNQSALGLGLDATTIATQLRSAYYGASAGEVQVDAETYDIFVRLNDRARSNLDDLDAFNLTTPSGSQIPLVNVTTKETARGYTRINRVESQRAVTIRGDVDTGRLNVSAMLNDVQIRFLPELKKKYPGVTVTFLGEAKEGSTTQASMGKALLFGLIGIFVLLSFQFKSYLEPITVMLAIPMALIGVIGGHWLMELDISMPSMMGFVSLAGIVVNDSILLVEFLKNGIRNGDTVFTAATQASRNRFRAILLTSLTTIAGMTPLLFETSLQAQVLIPLVCSLVFGIATTTLMVLFFVPSFYMVLNDFGLVHRIEVLVKDGDIEGNVIV